MFLKLDNIRKTFGEKVAVEIGSLTIDKGGIVGLVGNNGAGKTTLFRLILDLLKLDCGQISLGFDGQEPVEPSKSEEWKSQTGAYIDDGFLIDFLSPEEFFSFVGKTCGMKKADVEARLDRFSQLMAGEVMGQKKLIRDFSAGNKHKIGIIAALLSSPQLVILDEPFNFLDPSSQNHLKRLLADYAKETGAVVIVSSHNLQHTVDISSRILLMEHGHIVRDLDNADGSAEAVLDSYFGDNSAESSPQAASNPGENLLDGKPKEPQTSSEASA